MSPASPKHFNIDLAGDNYLGLRNRISEITYAWKCKTIRATGRFFFLNLQGNKPNVEDLIQVLYHKIADYCIPRTEIKKAKALYETTKETRHLIDLHDRAKDLFVKAKGSIGTSGEPAELVLFALIEAFLGAPQVLCKMYLKTSENVPVHGSDAVHLTYDDAQGLRLYWGESKLYAELSVALDAIVDSIAAFHDDTDGRSPWRRDIRVLVDHINIDSADAKKAVLEYFDPYSEKPDRRTEVHVCLAGFDWAEIAKLTAMTPAEANKAFREKYLTRIESACQLFEDKVAKKGLTALEFVFFLLPLESVSEFRAKFFKRLGVQS